MNMLSSHSAMNSSVQLISRNGLIAPTNIPITKAAIVHFLSILKPRFKSKQVITTIERTIGSHKIVAGMPPVFVSSRNGPQIENSITLAN